MAKLGAVQQSLGSQTFSGLLQHFEDGVEGRSLCCRVCPTGPHDMAERSRAIRRHISHVRSAATSHCHGNLHVLEPAAFKRYPSAEQLVNNDSEGVDIDFLVVAAATQ